MTKTKDTMPDWLPRKALRIVYVSSYYDYPLVGTCRVRGVFCKFTVIGCTGKRYRIHRLTWIEKIQWRWRQRLFEACVGTHWTYPKRTNFVQRRPFWFWRLVTNLYYGMPLHKRGLYP